jgi:hypothetical protein
MHGQHSAGFGLDENGVALLLGEFDHRICNMLMMIEALTDRSGRALFTFSAFGHSRIIL